MCTIVASQTAQHNSTTKIWERHTRSTNQKAFLNYINIASCLTFFTFLYFKLTHANSDFRATPPHDDTWGGENNQDYLYSFLYCFHNTIISWLLAHAFSPFYFSDLPTPPHHIIKSIQNKIDGYHIYHYPAIDKTPNTFKIYGGMG